MVSKESIRFWKPSVGCGGGLGYSPSLPDLIWEPSRRPRLRRPSCRSSQQISHSHQVVSCGGEDEHPVHSFSATMAQFAQQANRLQPTEDLFDPFALPLTDLVARVPRGATDR